MVEVLLTFNSYNVELVPLGGKITEVIGIPMPPFKPPPIVKLLNVFFTAPLYSKVVVKVSGGFVEPIHPAGYEPTNVFVTPIQKQADRITLFAEEAV